MSRHERYSLVRRRIGTPSVLTYIATFYKGADSVPTLQDLKSKIQRLCKLYPILCSQIDKASSNKPVLKTVPFDEKTVYSRVLEKTIRTKKGTDAARIILQECLQWGAAFNPESGDLWRVGRYLDETSGEVTVVLCADHILGDGRGVLCMLTKLLNGSIVSPDIPATLPPALEDKVSIKPALTTLLRVIVQALLVPKLPAWLVPDFLKPKTFWPFDIPVAISETLPPTKSVLQAEVGILVGRWNTSQVQQIRSALDKSLPSATLHAVMSACAMAALWIADSQISHEASARNTRIKLTTPTSERSRNLGHPEILGNYVGSVDTVKQMGPTSDFLQIVGAYSDELRRNIDSKLPATAWGMLDYIDDPDISNSKDGLDGWTSFFLDKATSKEPYSGSLEVSNLGLVPLPGDKLQKDIKRFAWMQTPTAIGSALAMNVVGCRSREMTQKQGDISLSITWRKDSVAFGRLSESWVGEFVRVLEQLPDVIATCLQEKASVSLADLQLATSTLAQDNIVAPAGSPRGK